MAEHPTTHATTPSTNTPACFHDVLSWRAIIAGAVGAMAIQLLLTVLGMAIGLNIAQDGAGTGLAVSSGIWLIISACIALFFGGWIAGCMGRSCKPRVGILHGFLQWSLVTALSLYMVTSAVGVFFGGVMRVTETVGSTAGQAAQAMAPDIGAGDLPWQDIEPQVEEIIATQAPEAVQQQDGERQVDLVDLARQFLTASDQVDAAELRKRLETTLQRQLDLSKEEAGKMVQELEQTYSQAEERARELWQETKETSVEAAQKATEVGADAAWWVFFSLLLGIAASAAGGMIGALQSGSTVTAGAKTGKTAAPGEPAHQRDS